MSKNIVTAALKHGLYTGTIGRRILYYQRLTSTMDKATEEAKRGTEDGTVIIAEEQTSGRGRFRRIWTSPPHNLYLSTVLRPSNPVLSFLSLLTGLSVVRAIERITHLSPTIKWPNDVQLNGKKVAGILIEGSHQASEDDYTVIGIGINVNTHPGEISTNLINTATSLRIETGNPVSRELLLVHLLQELDSLYVETQKGKFPIMEWRQTVNTLGKRIEILWGTRVYVGQATDVDNRGNLVLRLDNNSTITLPAGEVTLNRE